MGEFLEFLEAPKKKGILRILRDPKKVNFSTIVRGLYGVYKETMKNPQMGWLQEKGGNKETMRGPHTPQKIIKCKNCPLMYGGVPGPPRSPFVITRHDISNNMCVG